MKCDGCGGFTADTVTREWVFGKKLASRPVGTPYQTLGGLQQAVQETFGDFHHSSATLCPGCVVRRRRTRRLLGLLFVVAGLGVAAALIVSLGDPTLGTGGRLGLAALAGLLVLAGVVSFLDNDVVWRDVALAKLGGSDWISWTPDEFEALRSRAAASQHAPLRSIDHLPPP